MTSFQPPEIPSAQPSAQPDALQPALQPDLAIALPNKRLPGWRLWVPLALQSMLILAVPAQDAYTYATGRTVTLQTIPVDPYDLLRGYSQTLRYEISPPETLEKLPGGSWFAQQPQEKVSTFYLVLQAPAQIDTTTDTTPPQPWKPVRVSGDRPANLPENQIALQGQYRRGYSSTVTYGLETYYMPEDQRQQINDEISQIQRRAPAVNTPQPAPNQPAPNQPAPNQQAFVVNVKVDAHGNSVPVSLWVGDRNHRF